MDLQVVAKNFIENRKTEEKKFTFNEDLLSLKKPSNLTLSNDDFANTIKKRKYENLNFTDSVVKYHLLFNESFKRCFDRILKIFEQFDPINTVGEFKPFTKHFFANICEGEIVFSKFDSINLSKNILKTTDNDNTCNALISIIASWNVETLKKFTYYFPKYEKLLNLFLNNPEFRTCYEYVTENDETIPFSRLTFKILNIYLKDSINVREPFLFDFQKYITSDALNEFYYYDKLMELGTASLRDIQNLEMPKHALFADLVLEYENETLRKYPIKAISGMACVGKSTLLNKFKNLGWNVLSRGCIGTFHAKAYSPIAVSSLHMALDSALRRPKVIGDRFSIDNPLWPVIMQNCNPNCQDFVRTTLNYLSPHLNEAVIEYLSSHKAIIILDLFAEENKKRMRKRCEGGDAHRSRIQNYQRAQFCAYLIVARLFGWKIVCLPYTKSREIDSVSYNFKFTEIYDYLNGALEENVYNDHMYSKTNGECLVNLDYAKEIHIFK